MKMDALYLTEPGKIEVRSVEVEPPAANQVQVETHASGICAWDRHLFVGQSLCGNTFPFCFGHEGAGVVQAVGSGVRGFKPGDNVFYSGGHSMTQAANVDMGWVGHLPDTVETFAHWIGEPVTCVINSIDQIDTVPGERVAVIGVGYMGLLHIQGLSRTLSGIVTAFDLVPWKLELARAFGVDETVDLSSDAGRATVEQMKAEKAFNTVIETSGTTHGLQLAHDLLRNAGTLSVFGWHRAKREIDGDRWMLGGLRILNPSPMSDPHFRERHGQASVLMRKGVFHQERLMTHVADYRKAQALFEHLATNPGDYIKGAITFA